MNEVLVLVITLLFIPSLMVSIAVGFAIGSVVYRKITQHYKGECDEDIMFEALCRIGNLSHVKDHGLLEKINKIAMQTLDKVSKK